MIRIKINNIHEKGTPEKGTPRHARPDEKKKKSKTREKEKKKPSNIRKNTSVHSSAHPQHPHVRTHPCIPSIRTSALIHTLASIRLSVQIFRSAFDISPGGLLDGRRLCTSAFRRFFFRSSAEFSPSNRVWRNGVIIGRKVKDKRERGLPGRQDRG